MVKSKKLKLKREGFVNPFDKRANAKAKHSVLGKKIKGELRNVAVARSMAEQRRRTTLLSQFKNRKKQSAFKDRRIGETDENMTAEDKMLKRFQAERKRKHRVSAAYNLGSDNEEDDKAGREEDVLTHGGLKIDDYDALNKEDKNYQNNSDDDDGNDYYGPESEEMTKQAHFGGDEAADQGRKKTHQEVMQEVIAKSKFYKAEKHKAKAFQEQSTEDLDKTFGEIQGLLSFRPKKHEFDAFAAAAAESGDQAGGSAAPDLYAKLTRELTFEAKAKALERKKSAKELATEKRDKLVALEEERRRKTMGKPMALDDDEEEEEEEEEIDDGETLDVVSNVEEEQDDDDDDDDENDDKKEENEEEAMSTSSNNLLPFIFACPTNPNELAAVLNEHARSIEDTSVILERIRVYYSPDISPDNHKPMKALCASLMRRISVLATASYQTHKQEIQVLAQEVSEIARLMPSTAVDLFRKLLLQLQSRLVDKSSVNDVTFQWPQDGEVLLLRLGCTIFSPPSTSETEPATKAPPQPQPQQHPQTNPILPLMELYLAQVLKRGSLLLHDAACTATASTVAVEEVFQGLFCAQLLIECAKRTKAYFPEVGQFLCRLLVFTAYYQSSSAKQSKKQKQSKNARMTMMVKSKQSIFAGTSLRTALLRTVEAFVVLLGELPSRFEVLRRLEDALLLLEGDKAHRHDELDTTTSRERILQTTATFAPRSALQLRPIAPVSIQSLEPKFDENYTIRKDSKLDRESAQMKQLQRQVKRERKAAARELRLDAAFLARERDAEQSRANDDQKVQQREIQNWLTEQAATFNQQVKKGGGLLRGGGSGPAKRGRVN